MVRSAGVEAGNGNPRFTFYTANGEFVGQAFSLTLSILQAGELTDKSPGKSSIAAIELLNFVMRRDKASVRRSMVEEGAA
jgi:hypothetical protein